ncbi:Hypothetical protein FKW44_005293, partial [Caligus rogercresseyi]
KIYETKMCTVCRLYKDECFAPPDTFFQFFWSVMALSTFWFADPCLMEYGDSFYENLNEIE